MRVRLGKSVRAMSLFGDDDGVCVVAYRDAAPVFDAAPERKREEQALQVRLASGETLWSMAKFGAGGEAAGPRVEFAAQRSG